jgi:hypothetical protein
VIFDVLLVNLKVERSRQIARGEIWSRSPIAVHVKLAIGKPFSAKLSKGL